MNPNAPAAVRLFSLFSLFVGHIDEQRKYDESNLSTISWKSLWTSGTFHRHIPVLIDKQHCWLRLCHFGQFHLPKNIPLQLVTPVYQNVPHENDMSLVYCVQPVAANGHKIKMSCLFPRTQNRGDLSLHNWLNRLSNRLDNESRGGRCQNSVHRFILLQR